MTDHILSRETIQHLQSQLSQVASMLGPVTEEKASQQTVIVRPRPRPQLPSSQSPIMPSLLLQQPYRLVRQPRAPSRPVLIESGDIRFAGNTRSIDNVGFGPNGFGGVQRRVQQSGQVQRDIVSPPRRQFPLQGPAPDDEFHRVIESLTNAGPWVEFDVSAIDRAVMESFQMAQTQTRRQDARSLPDADLSEKVVGPDESSKECDICYVEIPMGSTYVQTTCCGTKIMHYKCALHCLRQSDLCPFCRAAKISFK